MQEDKHRYFHIASITLLQESYLGYIKTPFSRGRNFQQILKHFSLLFSFFPHFKHGVYMIYFVCVVYDFTEHAGTFSRAMLFIHQTEKQNKGILF